MATTTKKKRYATHITLPSGKRVYVSAKTKEELDEKVLQAKLEVGAGVDLGNDTLFNDYATTWLEAYKKPKLRPISYLNMEQVIRTHFVPFFEGMKLRDIKPMHIQLFLSQKQNFSRSFQSKCIVMLSGIFDSAVENGLIYKSPVTKGSKPGGRPPKKVEALTQEQARALLEAVKGTQAYTFCFLALSTGMRRGEIVGLMWDDIDFEQARITVQHNLVLSGYSVDIPVTTVLKTEASNRVIPVLPELLEHLIEVRKTSNSPYVLSRSNGDCHTMGSFRGLWGLVETRTASEKRPLGSVSHGGKNGKVTVSLDFTCHPHQLRHTCITQWVESGMDFKEVQYLAGHSTLDKTLRVYAHYRLSSRATETAQKVCSASSYLVE